MADYNIVNGLWDGKTTGNADLDYQLLKQNEAILGKDDQSIKDTRNKLETGFEQFEDDVMAEVDKIPGWGKKAHQFLTYLYYFRWIINLWVDAVPWTIICITLLFWNVFVNIAWNKWWAGGNLFLIGTSLYHIIFGIHSTLLIYEFPPYLRATKFWRQIANLTAWTTSIIYIAFIIKWLIMLYGASDDESGAWDFVSIFEAMYLGYNILLNISILPINFKIIVKELSLPYWQFLSPNAGHDNDSESINSWDTGFFIEIFNPYTYFDTLFRWIFKWDFSDTWKENTLDEPRYFLNWFKQ